MITNITQRLKKVRILPASANGHSDKSNGTPQGRLVSLDVMRGLIMIFLAGESCLVYVALRDLQPNQTVANVFDILFHHHPWNGLRLWDLIQPAFMLMAGSALYISYHNKQAKGVSWGENFKHVAVRCFKLFFLGVLIHCLEGQKLVWELWNVLTQLAVTTIIAYLIIRKSSAFQIAFSLGLLVLTEVLYRHTHIPGYDQPFVIGKNFGSYFDMLVMGKTNQWGWVAINVLPTAAHTIWGVVAGKLLVSQTSVSNKIKTLAVAGCCGLILGFGLDWTSITPIIKRISTTSFVLASGGWVLLFMAFLYWLVDVKKINRYAWLFVMVGMNSVFIYLFFETVGYHWFDGFVAIFVKGFTGMVGTPEKIQALLSALVTLAAEVYLCYWLYKKKIFFKL
jgi:predicted acyltransferase